MWVVDNKKQTAKNYINNDLVSNMTNLSGEIEKMKQTISMIDHSIGGIPSGMDNELEGCLQSSIREMQYCLGVLQNVKSKVSELEVREWVSDGDDQ